MGQKQSRTLGVTAKPSTASLAGAGSAAVKPDEQRKVKAAIETLNATFAAKFAEIDAAAEAGSKDMPEERKQQLTEFMTNLAKSTLIKTAVREGDRCTDFALTNHAGEPVQLTKLLAEGPVVLAFVRGSWCPYCTTYMHELQEAYATFKRMGATLVVVSTEPSEAFQATLSKIKPEYFILSDSSFKTQSAFGLVYDVPPEIERVYEENLKLLNWDQIYGSSRASTKLLVTATYVVDKDGVVSYSHLDADFAKRAPVSQIATALAWSRAVL